MRVSFRDSSPLKCILTVTTHTLQLFVKSKDPVFSKLFEAPEAVVSASRTGGRKKGASFQTVAMIHKAAVEHLLTTLRSTTPHFIR